MLLTRRALATPRSPRRRVPGSPMLEVGSYCGRSTIWLGAAARRRPARSCSPSTTTAARRRTRPGGSTTTRRWSTRDRPDGHAAVLPRARSTTPASRTSVIAVVGRSPPSPPLGHAAVVAVHRRRARRTSRRGSTTTGGRPTSPWRHAGDPRRVPRPGRRRPAAVRGDLRAGAGVRTVPAPVGHRFTARAEVRDHAVDSVSMAQLLGPVDLHLIGEGRHRRLWEVLGSEPRTVDGVEGTAFAVWAPNARAVRVVGDWNNWDGRVDPLQPQGVSGVWAVFVPGVQVGRPVQVRGHRRRRVPAPAGRSDGPAGRGAAEHGQHRRRVLPRVGRRRLAGGARRRRSRAPPVARLRGAPRFVAAPASATASWPRSWPTTWRISASPTSSSCRWPSIRSPARGVTR